jgi:hypothetical protein
MPTLFFLGALLATSPCNANPQPKEVIKIPIRQIEDATSRARLADLLIESLRDTSAGKVNAERERIIRKLSKKLSKGER